MKNRQAKGIGPKAGDVLILLSMIAIAFCGTLGFAQTVECPSERIGLSRTEKQDLADLVRWQDEYDHGKISLQEFGRRIRARMIERGWKIPQQSSTPVIFQL